MQYKILIKAGLLALFAAVSNLYAAGDSPNPLTKDVWLKQSKETIPAIICKEILHNQEINKKSLTAKININEKQCINVMPAIFNTCKTKYYKDIPAHLDASESQKWSLKLSQCIGEEFIIHHLNPVKPIKTAKKAWIIKVRDNTPEILCTSFFEDAAQKEKLTALHIDYGKCISLISPITGKCLKKYASELPESLTKNISQQWQHAVNGCITNAWDEKLLGQ